MSHFIGDKEIPVIEEVRVTDTIDIQDVYLVPRNTPMVSVGDNPAMEIELDVILSKYHHSEEKEIKDQREDMHALADRDLEENDFTYLHPVFEGYLSVETVNIPEKGDSPTIRSGTITGKYLPWPKFRPGASEPSKGFISFGGSFGDNFGN